MEAGVFGGIWYNAAGNTTIALASANDAGPPASLYQLSTTAATPTLYLSQQDESEGFIDFVGTMRGAIATSTTNSEGSIRVEIGGVVKRIPYFADG